MMDQFVQSVSRFQWPADPRPTGRIKSTTFEWKVVIGFPWARWPLLQGPIRWRRTGEMKLQSRRAQSCPELFRWRNQPRRYHLRRRTDVAVPRECDEYNHHKNPDRRQISTGTLGNRRLKDDRQRYVDRALPIQCAAQCSAKYRDL